MFSFLECLRSWFHICVCVPEFKSPAKLIVFSLFKNILIIVVVTVCVEGNGCHGTPVEAGGVCPPLLSFSGPEDCQAYTTMSLLHEPSHCPCFISLVQLYFKFACRFGGRHMKGFC